MFMTLQIEIISEALRIKTEITHIHTHTCNIYISSLVTKLWPLAVPSLQQMSMLL